MTPGRRSSATYRPKRDRREVTIAVLTGVAILLFTAIMVWALGPHDSGSSTPSTTTPTTLAGSTVPGASTDTTGTTTPASSDTAGTTTPTTGAATTVPTSGG
jgi:hypothetical protein